MSIILSLTALWISYGLLFESSIESPDYKMLTKHKTYEVRHYDHINIVAVNMTNESNSFRSLFNFISGNNDASLKIKMTAPVISSDAKMMFVLPADLENIPNPIDQNLVISEIKDFTVAVKSFSGYARNSKQVYDSFLSEIESDDYNPKGEWYVSQYNSPWVIPFMRKNEIWIVIDSKVN